MIGSFISRGLLLVFGYAYPAYVCYKTVEMNKPDVNQLRFWCQYWILVAGLTVLERIGDMFIGWVPLYAEAKVAFFIYLWFPKTKGTTYVYDSFFRPYLAKHETEIDRNLLKLRSRVGDMAILYYQKAASYGETRVYDVLQYIASQSTLHQHQPHKQGSGAAIPTASSSSSRTSNTSSTEQAEQETVSANMKASDWQESRTTPTPSISESMKTSSLIEGQTVQIDSSSPEADEKPHSPQDAILEEEGVQVTEARFRRTRSSSGR